MYLGRLMATAESYCILGGEGITDLELLAFDEYCRFDTSAFVMRIKRSLYTHNESRSIKTAISIES